MLTVDPKKRLTMAELQSCEWIRGSITASTSGTPLKTPDVLSLTHNTMTHVNGKVNRTMNAFHLAHKEGFRLQNVDAAPLAKRRKKKRSSSSSTDSIASFGSPSKGMNSPLRNSPARNSPCSLRSSPIRNLSNNSSSSAASGMSTQSTGFQPILNPARHNLENSGYFSFRDTKIASLLGSTVYNPSPLVEDSSLTIPNRSDNRGGIKRSYSEDNDLQNNLVSTSQLKTDSYPSRPSTSTADDDCMIVGESSANSAPVRTGSDIANNNAKRIRSDTIVIDD